VKNPAHRQKKSPHRGELIADPTVGKNGIHHTVAQSS
jgi:hypothetical protein